MTVPSKFNPHLFRSEMLSEKDLAKRRLSIAAMTTLHHLSESGGIGLTKSGAFNRKCVVWAVGQFEWPGYSVKELAVANKVLNEDDVPPPSCLNGLLRVPKIVRHANGRSLRTRARTAPTWAIMAASR